MQRGREREKLERERGGRDRPTDRQTDRQNKQGRKVNLTKTNKKKRKFK